MEKEASHLDITTNEGRRSAALDYAHEYVKQEESENSDGVDLENAAVEEIEDLLLSVHARAKRPLEPSEISKYSRGVSQDELNQSIVSVIQGRIPMNT